MVPDGIYKSKDLLVGDIVTIVGLGMSNGTFVYYSDDTLYNVEVSALDHKNRNITLKVSPAPNNYNRGLRDCGFHTYWKLIRRGNQKIQIGL